MGLSKRLRFEAFKRDLFTCQYCGRRPPDVALEADHIHPLCDGGKDEIDNLVTACWDCNHGKAGVSLGETAPALNELDRLEAMQEMLERKRILQDQAQAAAQLEDAEDNAIVRIQVLWGDLIERKDAEFDWESIRRFIRQGLPITAIRDAVQVTAARVKRSPRLYGKARWKYFCGCCWTTLRGPKCEQPT